jgi:hypothetical protein
MWMLHEFIWKILAGENVHVNVTWGYLKDIDWGKCLCKCYTRLFKIYEQWQMFIQMLHEFVQNMWTVDNVYVNVTLHEFVQKMYAGENVYVNVTLHEFFQ